MPSLKKTRATICPGWARWTDVYENRVPGTGMRGAAPEMQMDLVSSRSIGGEAHAAKTDEGND